MVRTRRPKAVIASALSPTCIQRSAEALHKTHRPKSPADTVATLAQPRFDNVMGPVKAALASSCRYLACEVGAKGIRVHPISPRPLKTRAASGLNDFDLMLNEAAGKAPVGELVDIMA